MMAYLTAQFIDVRIFHFWKRLTKGKFNLFKNERLLQNPVTFPLHISLPGNQSLNFEDSRGTSLVGSPHLINKLAIETKNPIAAWYRNEFFNTAAHS